MSLQTFVSPFGLFIVETKNYKGWIFGSESESSWTQVIYKSKYSFQNPLRQTHRHKKVLSKYLGINELHIQTVISFVGDVKFKTELPSNVFRSGVGSYIKKFKDKVFSDKEIERIIDLLSNVKSEINIYNQNRNEKIKKFNKLKVENTNNLLKLINPILAKYSTEKNISIILQKKNLIIGKTELDITDEIIKIIDNEIKEFKIK